MKRFKKVIVWIMASLIVQTAGLFYLDKFYFVSEKNFKSTKVEKPAKPVPKNVTIDIPSSAKHVSASYDGKYLAYYEGDTLKVVDTVYGTKKDISFDKGTKVSYYKWLPDMDSMIIAEKQSTKSGEQLKFSNYDVAKDKKKEIKDDRHDNPDIITLSDKTSEVEDIEISTLTNIIYIKIGHKGGRNSIYQINVMSEIEKVRINSYMTGNIVSFPHDVKLAYEDLTYHRVYVTDTSAPISIKGVTDPCVLAVDSDDNIYIGQQVNGKVKRIYYGTLKGGTDKWKYIDINNPVDKNDISINQDGKIFVNDNLKGVVTDVASGKETSYRGEFMQVYSDGVISNSDGTILKTKF